MKTQPQISDYDQQAIYFLESTNTTLNVVYSHTDKYFSNDTEKRDIYRFTFANDKYTYSALFGDSIHNTESRRIAKENLFSRPHQIYGNRLQQLIKYGFSDKTGRNFSTKNMRTAINKTPSSYDILACMDSYAPDTFEDFCSEFGYDDSPLSEHDNIMRIFLNVREQVNAMRKLFTSDELDTLSEIN